MQTNITADRDDFMCADEFPECRSERDQKAHEVDNFTLSIDLGNAAMQTPDQIADALRKVAEKLTDRGDFSGPEDGTIRDYNGNTVGQWNVA